MTTIQNTNFKVQHGARLSLCAAAAMALAACGGSNDGAEADSQNGASQIAGSETAARADAPPLNATLSTAPIDLSKAYSPLKVQQAEPPACPWLSDESATAAVRNPIMDKPIRRRMVNADRCEWNVNAGFAFTVTATPLATASDPATQSYNLDNPPVVAEQDGPGEDAVLLLDPTWDAEDPRPYGFVFEAEGRQIEIKAIGMETSAEQLRTVADEIAAKLPDAQPVADAAPAPPAFEPCVFESEALAALFGGVAGDSLTVDPDVAYSACDYDGYVRGGNYRVDLSVSFRGDPLDVSRIQNDGYEVAANLGDDVYVKDTSAFAGYGASSRTYLIARPDGEVRVDLKVGEENFPENAAGAIVENLVART